MGALPVMNALPAGRPPARRFMVSRHCVAAICLVLASCTNSGGKTAEIEDRLRAFEAKSAEQARQLLEREEVVRRQEGQIRTLQMIGGQDRMHLLCPVERIEIEGMSGGYDHDGRPGDDGVVVYVQPRDQDGDVVKAAGMIHVQVLDLANPPAQQLLVEQRWKPEEARTVWYGRLMTQHYTLRMPFTASVRPQHDSLTVRVVFVDVLTGKTFEAQKVVKFKLPPR